MKTKPEQYKPVTIGEDFDLGLGGNIHQLYAQYLDTSQPGQIVAGATTLTVAPECVAMLKAILQAGCCRIEERAHACRVAFEKCVLSKTPSEFFSKLPTDADDSFAQAIYEAVKKEWNM